MVKLRFVVRSGKLVLRISENKERFYRSVDKVLIGDPQIPKHWDDGKERLTRCAAYYKENNALLKDYKDNFVKAVVMHPDWDAKRIAAIMDTASPDQPQESKPEQNDTVAAFIEKVVQREKAKQGCNYELYEKFLKKARKIVPDFDTLTFQQITYDKCVWIAGIFAKHPGYFYSMKVFCNVLGKAAKDRSVSFKMWQIEDFQFRDYDPDKDRVDLHKPDVLTQEQVTAFMNMNPKTMTPSCRDRVSVQMFYDFCVMMLHTMMAPCDVAKLKPRDITKSHTFMIKRKKTHRALEIPITPQVDAIIAKYKGLSPCGYIMPIINEKVDARQTIRDYTSKKFRQRLNEWLKIVGKELGLSFGLYAYVFRHTAITMALDGGLPVPYVASIAGTSIEMIQKHYYNAESQKNAEIFQANLTNVCGSKSA